MEYYLIIGYTGEYDEYIEWSYGVYEDVQKASEDCKNMNIKLTQFNLHTSSMHRKLQPEYAILDAFEEQTDDNDFDYNGLTGSAYEIRIVKKRG